MTRWTEYGPGDEETWPQYHGDPNDPREPEPDDDKDQETDDDQY